MSTLYCPSEDAFLDRHIPIRPSQHVPPFLVNNIQMTSKILMLHP